MGRGRKINFYKILTVILAIALVVILILWGRSRMIQRQAEQDFEDLAAQVNSLQNETVDSGVSVAETETETAEPTEGEAESAQIEIPQKNLDWDKLAETNSDIYAWIYIPGTKIDYPVMQHPSDDSYYLNYNMNGTRGYPGCIYTECQNSRDFTDFETVIYGHNMKNDTMFTTLHDYEDETFFLNCPYIYIYTDNKVLVYDIFAAYTGDDAHILNTNDFSTEEGCRQYLDGILSQGRAAARLREDVAQEITTESRMLTLSTCVSGKSDERFLVQAVLVSEAKL